MISRLIRGIYKALNTSAELVAAQVEDLTIRPSVKIIAKPAKVERINSGLCFTTYEITVGYFTSDKEDYEDEATAVMQDFIIKLSEEIELPDGVFIYLDNIEGEVYDNGLLTISATTLIDTLETEDITENDGDLMEELMLNKEEHI